MPPHGDRTRVATPDLPHARYHRPSRHTIRCPHHKVPPQQRLPSQFCGVFPISKTRHTSVACGGLSGFWYTHGDGPWPFVARRLSESPQRDSMARYLYIVSLQRWALFDELLGRFSADPKAQVILDRRRLERRQAHLPVVCERRRADRRRLASVSEELRRRSVAVVTIP